MPPSAILLLFFQLQTALYNASTPEKSSSWHHFNTTKIELRLTMNS